MKKINLIFFLVLVPMLALAQFNPYIHNAYDTQDVAQVDIHVESLFPGAIGITNLEPNVTLRDFTVSNNFSISTSSGGITIDSNTVVITGATNCIGANGEYPRTSDFSGCNSFTNHLGNWFFRTQGEGSLTLFIGVGGTNYPTAFSGSGGCLDPTEGLGNDTYTGISNAICNEGGIVVSWKHTTNFARVNVIAEPNSHPEIVTNENQLNSDSPVKAPAFYGDGSGLSNLPSQNPIFTNLFVDSPDAATTSASSTGNGSYATSGTTFTNSSFGNVNSKSDSSLYDSSSGNVNYNSGGNPFIGSQGNANYQSTGAAYTNSNGNLNYIGGNAVFDNSFANANWYSDRAHYHQASANQNFSGTDSVFDQAHGCQNFVGSGVMFTNGCFSDLNFHSDSSIFNGSSSCANYESGGTIFTNGSLAVANWYSTGSYFYSCEGVQNYANPNAYFIGCVGVDVTGDGATVTSFTNETSLKVVKQLQLSLINNNVRLTSDDTNIISQVDIETPTINRHQTMELTNSVSVIFTPVRTNGNVVVLQAQDIGSQTYSTNVTLVAATSLVISLQYQAGDALVFTDTNYVISAPNDLVAAVVTSRTPTNFTLSFTSATLTSQPIEGVAIHR